MTTKQVGAFCEARVFRWPLDQVEEGNNPHRIVEARRA
jgi:hypothetical protein